MNENNELCFLFGVGDVTNIGSSFARIFMPLLDEHRSFPLHEIIIL